LKSCRRTTEDGRLSTEQESFEIGELVRVADGPFASFRGTVQEVDDARSCLRVVVSVYGSATPVELEFGQVEKL
jgi:transcription termination/antitermination protein NusG